MHCTQTFCCSYCKKTDQVTNFNKHKYCRLMLALCKQTLEQPSWCGGYGASTTSFASGVSFGVNTHIANPTKKCCFPARQAPSLMPSDTAGSCQKHFFKNVLVRPSEMTEMKIAQLTAMFVSMPSEHFSICVESIVDYFFERCLLAEPAPCMQLIDSLCQDKLQGPSFAMHFVSPIAGIVKIAYFNSSFNKRTVIKKIILSWITRLIFPTSAITEIEDFVTRMDGVCSLSKVHGQIGLNHSSSTNNNSNMTLNAYKRRGDQVLDSTLCNLPMYKKPKLCVEKNTAKVSSVKAMAAKMGPNDQ